MKYSYLIWLLLFVVLPLVVLWILHFKTLKKYSKVLFYAVIGALIFSYPWDYTAIKENIWYFTKPQIVGVLLLGIPVEEWFFIIFVTLLFSTTTILLWKKFDNKT